MDSRSLLEKGVKHEYNVDDSDSHSLLKSNQLDDPTDSSSTSSNPPTSSSTSFPTSSPFFFFSSPSSKRIAILTALSALGGFLFGYDTGVVSGAMLLISDDFNLSSTQQEVCVSSTIVMAAMAALFGGSLNARYGRRPVIIFAAIVFAIGSLVMGLSPNFEILIVGRVIVGIGIGFASLTTPIYIAEVAPPALRGRLVTINTFCICFGQFFAGMIDGVLSNTPNGWRIMLGLAIVPSLIMLIGFIHLPESPRWLIMNGKRNEALEVMKTVRASSKIAQEEVDDIVTACIALDTLQSSSNTSPKNKVYEMMSHPPTRRALLLGCGLMILQQLVGINTVMYYAASIYEMAGYSTTTSIWLSGFTALAQVIGLIYSIYMVEKIGRRPLLLYSLFFVILSLIALGSSFYAARVSSGEVTTFTSTLSTTTTTTPGKCESQSAFVWSGTTKYCYDCVQISGCGYCMGDGENNSCVEGDSDGAYGSACGGTWIYDSCPNPYGSFSVICMISYLLAFGVGMGGMPWTVNSEIYPLKYRSLAVSFSTTSNWLGNIVISATFLTISSPKALTTFGAFWLYAVIGMAGYVWLFFTLPETKGLSLEDIESLFVRKGDKLHDPFDNLSEEQKEAIIKMSVKTGGGGH